jgi:ribosomal protein S27E
MSDPEVWCEACGWAWTAAGYPEEEVKCDNCGGTWFVDEVDE